MLSFKLLSEESFDEILDILSPVTGDREITSDILDSFLDIAAEGCEVGVSAISGELLVRIFDDGRYSFVYPIEIGEETDTDSALIALSEYSVREMIPFCLTDTPREEIDRIRALFPHTEARAYDDDIDSFVVLIYSECDLIDGVPAIAGDGIVLDSITDLDTARYAELCRSEAVNRYWGYDFREDNADATDDYFLSVAMSELSRGVALSFAIRECDGTELIGEAVIYGFDFRGGASFAIRLLPDYQGRGLGSSALSALIGVAREIGLMRLGTEIMLENIPSIKMTEKQLERLPDRDGKARFSISLR